MGGFVADHCLSVLAVSVLSAVGVAVRQPDSGSFGNAGMLCPLVLFLSAYVVESVVAVLSPAAVLLHAVVCSHVVVAPHGVPVLSVVVAAVLLLVVVCPPGDVAHPAVPGLSADSVRSALSDLSAAVLSVAAGAAHSVSASVPTRSSGSRCVRRYLFSSPPLRPGDLPKTQPPSSSTAVTATSPHGDSFSAPETVLGVFELCHDCFGDGLGIREGGGRVEPLHLV